MPLKTYALIDLIGLSALIQSGQAEKILENFWNAADSWTTSQSYGPERPLGKNYTISPMVKVSTFSDSALLCTTEEFEIDVFYRIVKDFKACIEKSGCFSYAIVSRNDEITQPTNPALGGYLSGSDGIPAYTAVAGSGKAWVSLHAADKTITSQKNWHNQYSLYCVGDASLPKDRAFEDYAECKALGQTVKVYALC